MPLKSLLASGKDKKSFAFIICVSDEMMYRECCYYIQKLKIPRGMSIEIIPIKDAACMAAGFNAGMTETDAKYKIYMHQNVSILNPNFLEDILTIFKSDKKIAMIGMIGNIELPPDAVSWHGERVGNVYELDPDNMDFRNYSYSVKDGLYDVECVDGFLMATSMDMRWKQEEFDSWDFYDMAQCFEMRKKGMRVVVPEQKKPWCAHDEGVNNRWGFDTYRKRFMKLYMEKE
jgi:hypothetical protein